MVQSFCGKTAHLCSSWAVFKKGCKELAHRYMHCIGLEWIYWHTAAKILSESIAAAHFGSACFNINIPKEKLLLYVTILTLLSCVQLTRAGALTINKQNLIFTGS